MSPTHQVNDKIHTLNWVLAQAPLLGGPGSKDRGLNNPLGSSVWDVKQILWYAAGRKMNSYNHLRNTVAGKTKLKYIICYCVNFPSLYFHTRHKAINEHRSRYSSFHSCTIFDSKDEISSVNEPGKLNNHIVRQAVQAAQPPVSTFFLQPELLYLQWYVETRWSIVVDLTQR